jgi:hypothetical protein
MRRDLASRAVLIAAGVGTALGAGAGLANAAPLEQDLQQNDAGQNAFDQSAAPTGALPAAPSLPLTDALTATKASGPLDLPAAGGDQLAGLGNLGGLLGGAEAKHPDAPEPEASPSSNGPESTSEDNSTAAPAVSGAQGSPGNATDTKAGSDHTAASPSARDGEYSSSYGTH